MSGKPGVDGPPAKDDDDFEEFDIEGYSCFRYFGERVVRFSKSLIPLA